MLRPQPSSTLFPYTTLFRSGIAGLMLSVNGNLNSTQLIARLKEGSLPFPQTSSSLPAPPACPTAPRSEEHTSELQSHVNLVCRLLLEKKKNKHKTTSIIIIL